MHFKVFSLKRCYKWIFVFIFCILILTVSYAIKEKQNSKKQTENLINQVEEIENKLETEEKLEIIDEKVEKKIVFKTKEPTLEIPKEYEGWDVIRKTYYSQN